MSNEGLFIAKYADENGQAIHEIDAPHIDIQKDEIEDNCYIGNYKHIKIYTCPSWFIEGKPKVTVKGVKIKYNDSWKALADKYILGKVLKLRGAFYEITGLSLDISTDAVLESNWIDTDMFKADIIVKPYGSNENGNISIMVYDAHEVIKKW